MVQCGAWCVEAQITKYLNSNLNFLHDIYFNTPHSSQSITLSNYVDMWPIRDHEFQFSQPN